MGLLNNRWDLFQGLFRGYFEEMGKSILPEEAESDQKQQTAAAELQVGTGVATVKHKQIKPA